MDEVIAKLEEAFGPLFEIVPELNRAKVAAAFLALITELKTPAAPAT